MTGFMMREDTSTTGLRVGLLPIRLYTGNSTRLELAFLNAEKPSIKESTVHQAFTVDSLRNHSGTCRRTLVVSRTNRLYRMSYLVDCPWKPPSNSGFPGFPALYINMERHPQADIGIR